MKGSLVFSPSSPFQPFIHLQFRLYLPNFEIRAYFPLATTLEDCLLRALKTSFASPVHRYPTTPNPFDAGFTGLKYCLHLGIWIGDFPSPFSRPTSGLGVFLLYTLAFP